MDNEDATFNKLRQTPYKDVFKEIRPILDRIAHNVATDTDINDLSSELRACLSKHGWDIEIFQKEFKKQNF